MKTNLFSLSILHVLLLSGICHAQESSSMQKPWNIVFIMADDVGYGDIGAFGATQIKTPNIDQIAAQGMKCKAFYTHPICGPSRTAMLTGCYAPRVKQYPRKGKGKGFNHHPWVHLDEELIPEILKPQGYVSASFGKWDLNGHVVDFPDDITPRKHGFDYFYGRPCGGPQYLNDEISKTQAIPEHFDKVFTDHALQFIEEHKDTSPFFIHLCYYSAHTAGPLAASKEFLGSSEYGLYGDSVQEMDHHIGRLMQKLDEWGLTENTMVIFTSDNGPWHLKLRGNKPVTSKNRAGNPGPLRGQKTETWEGGCRTPFVIKAPGLIPAGTETNEIVRIVDLLPTFSALAGAELPKEKIDGVSQLPLLTGESQKSAVDYHFYYFQNHLQAVRNHRYKLVIPRHAFAPWAYGKQVMNAGGQSTDISEYTLYDMHADIGETTNVADQHPEVVAELKTQLEICRQDIGDYNIIGKNCRTDAYWVDDRAKWLHHTSIPNSK